MTSNFVIQLHMADKAGIHHDIRIEHNGVLVSWATKNLNKLLNDEKDKILLIKQPDHELEWMNFKGNIKEGYGKGKVLIYDKGKVNIIKWDKTITAVFYGRKVKGTFHIIHMSGNNYLMRKGNKKNEES